MNAFLPTRRQIQKVWVLCVVFALCVSVEFALLAADLGIWGTARWRALAYQNGGFWIGLLNNWQANYGWQPQTMFVTYGFLHGGVWHLVVNMFTLFALGIVIVKRIGQARFFLLYMFSMFGGGVGFAMLSSSYQPMVGASGALFGMAGALAAWEYVDRFTADEGLWPVVRMVTWLLILNLVLWWAMDGLLAWETHLGGFVAGWVAAFLVDPRSRPMV